MALWVTFAGARDFDPNTKFFHRLLVGFGITDEIFGISIAKAREGYVNPWYNYGAILISVPLWSLGTSLGIIAGNILPVRVVSALSVALYGMFIAIILSPAFANPKKAARFPRIKPVQIT